MIKFYYFLRHLVIKMLNLKLVSLHFMIKYTSAKRPLIGHLYLRHISPQNPQFISLERRRRVSSIKHFSMNLTHMPQKDLFSSTIFSCLLDRLYLSCHFLGNPTLSMTSWVCLCSVLRGCVRLTHWAYHMVAC